MSSTAKPTCRGLEASGDNNNADNNDDTNKDGNNNDDSDDDDDINVRDDKYKVTQLASHEFLD